MIDSTNPRILADNIRDLTDKQIVEAAEILALQGDVEALGSYSTTETNTGKKWIDNSDIYRKIIPVEAFPNNTSVSIPHGIENLGDVIDIYASQQAVAGVVVGRISNYSSAFILNYTKTNVVLQTTIDLSGAGGFILMEYTKSAAPTSLISPTPDDTRSIEPEEREEEPIIDEPIIDEPIEEPVVEVKKTTRKKTTTE